MAPKNTINVGNKLHLGSTFLRRHNSNICDMEKILLKSIVQKKIKDIILNDYNTHKLFLHLPKNV